MSDVKRYKLRAGMPDTAVLFLPDEVVSAADFDALRAELAAIKGQEPAGEVHLRKGGGICMLQVELHMPLPPGTKLYALPPAAPDVSGLVEALEAIKGKSGFDYSIRTQSTNSIHAPATPAVDIGRNAAFEACPDTGCDWSSFYRGWNAALAARAKESQQ